jgi:potassium-transporting ATPase KdpC subunit
MKSEKNTGHTMISHKENDQPGGSLLGHLWASIGVTIVLGVICCGVYPLVVWGLGQALFPVQANGSLLKKDGSFTTNDQEAVGSALIGQGFSLPGYFHPRPSAAGSGYDGTDSSGTNLGPLSDKLINGVTTPATTQPTTQPEALAFDGIRLRTIHYAVDNGIVFKLYHAVYLKHDDGSITLQNKDEVPLAQFQNKDGSLNDVALVDAFPHPTNGADVPDYSRTVLIAGDFTDGKGNPVLIPGDAVTASGSGLDPHISPRNAQLQADRVAATRKIATDDVQKLIDQYTDQPSLGVLGDPGVNVLRLNLALDVKFPLPAAPTTQPVSK